uniref:Uncharacterized protein n=1 Tax=Anopheles coluzzii TaxID=1518534 RepID=A0A8W7Q304_ANOCL
MYPVHYLPALTDNGREDDNSQHDCRRDHTYQIDCRLAGEYIILPGRQHVPRIDRPIAVEFGRTVCTGGGGRTLDSSDWVRLCTVSPWVVGRVASDVKPSKGAVVAVPYGDDRAVERPPSSVDRASSRARERTLLVLPGTVLVLANEVRAAELLEWKAAGEETVDGEAVKEVMVDGSAGRKAEILVPGVTLDDASRAVDHGHAVQACDSMVGRVPSVRAIFNGLTS